MRTRLRFVAFALFLVGCGSDDMDKPKDLEAVAHKTLTNSGEVPVSVYVALPPNYVGFGSSTFSPPAGYITVPANRTVLIHLPCLPSAGLTWRPADLGAFGDMWFESPPSAKPLLGAPQWQVFRFHSGDPGSSRVKMVYGLHVDKDATKATYEFQLETR